MSNIKGLDSLYTKLDKLADFQDRIKKIMYNACLPVQAQAKALARVKTGAMRRSIRIQVKIEDNKVIGIVGTTKEIYYAKFVEFGTSRARAFPFLRPSYEAHKENVIKTVKDGIAEELRRVCE